MTKREDTIGQNILNIFLDKPCNICKQSFPLIQMKVDYFDPSQRCFELKDLYKKSKIFLFQELLKCQALCQSCFDVKYQQDLKDEKYKSKQEYVKRSYFVDTVNNMKECYFCHQIKHTDLFRDKGDSDRCIECSKQYKHGRNEVKGALFK